MKHHETRKVTVNKEVFETKTQTDLDWAWKVKDVDAKGAATLEAKLTGLRVDITGRGYEFQYDSNGTNAGDEAYKKDLITLLDRFRRGAFRVKLASDGEVLEVHGFDPLVNEAPPESHVEDTNGLTLRDTAYAWYLQQALGRLPEAAVTPGGRWTRPAKQKLTALGEASGETTYQLAKPVEKDGRKLLPVEFSGTQSLDIDMKFAGGQLRGTMKIGKLKGTVLFDPKARSVARSDYTTDMAGDFRFNDNADAAIKVELRHAVSLEALP
jgi:hypothetical protein